MKALCTVIGVALALMAHGSDIVVYRSINAYSKGYYDAECNYPEIVSQKAVAKLANVEIKKWVASQRAEFLSQCKEEFKDPKNKPENEWTCNIESKVVFQNSRSLSVRVTVGSYTGGAHPTYADTTFNYAEIGGKAKKLAIADLYPKKPQYRKRMIGLLVAKLKATGNATWLEDGTVTTIETEQLNRFLIGPKALTFIFNPYEIGPWAVGNFEIPVSFKELGPDFKKAILGL